jgi:ABC-type sugar transport system ATPase subunit
MIYVTHDQTEAMTLGDRLAVPQGASAFTGSPGRLRTSKGGGRENEQRAVVARPQSSGACLTP